MTRLLLSLLAATALTACDASEKAANARLDAPLNAIVPDASAIDASADITPYILANGPQALATSPDGQTVAFRALEDGIPVLKAIPATGGETTTLKPGKQITFFRWLPDSSGLVIGADQDGNEQEAFFRHDLASGETSVLLDATDGGFRSFGAFAGDGSLFAYSSTERNGLDYDVYVHDLQTGESRIVSEGKYGQFVQAVSPDGSRIVVSTTVGEDADNLYLLDTATGERTTISEPTPRANHTDAGVLFSEDGNSLYFATNEGREYAAIARYDIADESFTGIYQGRSDVDSIERCGQDIAFTLNRDGFTALGFYNPVSEQGSAPAGTLDGVATFSCGGDTLAYLSRGGDNPGTIVVQRGEGTQPEVLVAPDLAGLDPRTLIKAQPIRMDARDGVELQSLLYLPANVQNPPVVFDIHGGPTAQSRPGWEPTTQYLLSKGVAVFHPNVRGSTGFGRTYATLDDRKLRLDSVRDLIDMLESEELSGRVDTSRAAVMGGSYGGYMVNAVLAAYPDAFDAGVALFGVGDWVTALEVASPALKASDLIEYGDITDPEWREFYTDISPIAQAENIRVPVLYSHGEQDPRIDIAETEVMVRALRKNGVDAQFVRIPDEGHGWRKLKNRQFYYPLEAAFLIKHLGVER